MRIAVVTGASSGIGNEFARQIAGCFRQLDEIWLIARDTKKLEKLSQELETKGKVSCRIFDGDLLRDYVYVRLEKALTKEHPDIRMLVNAAGIGRFGKAGQMDASVMEEMIALNCKALTKMTKLCLPYLTKGSRMVNIASAAAFAPQPGFAVYAASKAYVLSFSKGIGQELAANGIITTAVCPGPVDTPFFDHAGEGIPKLKSAVMAEPAAVVSQALRDSRDRKSISIYGKAMRGAYLAAKLLPDKLVLRWMNKMSN